MTAIINGTMVIGTPEEINNILKIQKEQLSAYDRQVCDNEERPDFPIGLKRRKGDIE